MNIASKARKSAIATLAALAVITAGAAIAPTQAQANTHVASFIGGAIIGGFIGAALQPRYDPYYAPVPVYNTCYTQPETRYNNHGQPYTVYVKYC